jgi:hypothetical protein
VFLLFQEIPGCATCKRFGAEPLSQPLLVEAIEDELVPCVVHNNEGGKDAAVLERYREPAWNNPVVRLVGDDGKDLIDRRDGVWSTGGIASRVRTVLHERGKELAWLDLLVLETSAEERGHAVFAMHCYWEGQAALGALDEVVAVMPGFVDGSEVVEVTYAGGIAALKHIAKRAEELDCAASVWAPKGAELDAVRSIVGDRARERNGAIRRAGADEHLYHLRRSPLRWLPLVGAQAVRVNSALGLGKDPSTWLSPRQRTLARRIDEHLARDAKVLDALARPAGVDDLGAYAEKLERALAR